MVELWVVPARCPQARPIANILRFGRFGERHKDGRKLPALTHRYHGCSGTRGWRPFDYAMSFFEFVVQHAAAIKQYFAIASHSPQVVQVIDAIEYVRLRMKAEAE